LERHRNCTFSVPPERAVELNNLCPVCHRRLTKGVEQRVLELSDRPQGFVPEDAIPYKYLLPLSEIVAAVTGSSSLYASSVQEIYRRLIPSLGDEFEVLLSSSKDSIVSLVGSDMAEAILEVRNGKADVIPGYDGVYGQPVFSTMRKPKIGREDDRDEAVLDTAGESFDGKLDKYLRDV